MRDARKRVRIEDIARRCKVGTTTVSRVINNRDDVSPGTRARVEKVIRTLGYVPSAAARRMAGGAPGAAMPTQTIAILSRPAATTTIVYGEILAALVNRATGMGYRVIVDTAAGTAPTCNYDGMILAANVRAALKSDTPCVTVDWLSSDPLVPGVLPDYETGAYHAAKVALSRAYRRPLLLTGSTSAPQRSFAGMLYRGYARALCEEGFTPKERVHGRSIGTKEQGYREAMRVLRRRRRPDLLFSNDDAAVGIYRAAAELGISVPDELGVLGCDGISLCEYLDPPLATIRIEFDALASETLRRLIPAINRSAGPHPQKLLLETEFVENGSIRRA